MSSGTYSCYGHAACPGSFNARWEECIQGIKWLMIAQKEAAVTIIFFRKILSANDQ